MAISTNHTELPVVVLVPGAWHSPVHYTQLIDLLGAKGYEVVTKRNLSCDSQDPDQESVASDAAAIRETLLSQIDAGKDVVLVMHSYGGCPGSAAAAGLSKAERSQEGKQGGIIGMAFMCAFLAAPGDSLLSKLPGQQFDSWVIQDVSIDALYFVFLLPVAAITVE
jgi:pimeloyl-ACP methyl ester carboxylesterase